MSIWVCSQDSDSGRGATEVSGGQNFPLAFYS